MSGGGWAVLSYLEIGGGGRGGVWKWRDSVVPALGWMSRAGC